MLNVELDRETEAYLVEILAQEKTTSIACASFRFFIMFFTAKSSTAIGEVFAHHGVTRGVFECTPLLPEDFSRIAELNEQYADLPGDFADLSLVAISERLNISAIVILDRDFDIYRRYRSQPFDRVFLPE
jgi:predicted nucleic acid-binding protein